METIKKCNRSKWTLLVLTGGMFCLMLTLNILTPYISKWTRHKPFGGVTA